MFKIGFLGAGTIASKVAETIMKLEDFQVYAVASRSEERAGEFAKKYHAVKIYTDYVELASDPDVDLIYISTPHSHHGEHAKLCINGGKPCLVEKAFSYNRATAKEVLDLAREKKVFCGEALWSRYNPSWLLIKQLIDQRFLGKLTNITVNIGYDIKKNERIVKPELAGGALLDIGIYPLAFAGYICGENVPQIVSAAGKFATGVDAFDTMICMFKNGVSAYATATTMYGTDRTATLFCESGYIKVTEFTCPVAIDVYSKDNELVQHFDAAPNQISGYEYEFKSAQAAIEHGYIEPVEMPHKDTLELMTTMDKLRAAWGIKYPME